MKRLLIVIMLLLFVCPVCAWECPLPKDPYRYLIKSPQIQTYPINPFELQNQVQQQRKQEGQLQEIIENQRKLLELQERMKRKQRRQEFQRSRTPNWF